MENCTNRKRETPFIFLLFPGNVGLDLAHALIWKSVAPIMRSKKTLLIILGLALLLGCVLVLTFRRERRVTEGTQRAPQTSEGPWFEIAVEAPLFNSRPPWEIPGVILGTRERGPKLNQNSPGVRIGKVTAHRLELSAEGRWDFLIETDSEGRLTPATHIAFPIKIGGRPNTFNCRPAEPPVGYLDIKGADSGEIECRGIGVRPSILRFSIYLKNDAAENRRIEALTPV